MANFDLPNIALLTKGVKKIFGELQNKPDRDYLAIATEIKTKSHTVDYAWLKTVPSMSAWVGTRNINKLGDNTYPIVKQDWEATIQVMRDDFLFDNLGIVKPKVQQLHHSVIKHYNSLIYSLITTNGVCFDGAPFFGPHTVGTGVGAPVYNNSGVAKLTELALFDVISFMQGIKDEQGEPLGINPSMLLIAPNLLRTAKQIIGARTLAASDNIAFNLLDVKVIPNMPANSWVVLDTTQPLKPFILQITKEGKIEEDRTKMFSDRYVLYGIDTMDNAGYGFWQMAHYSNGTV